MPRDSSGNYTLPAGNPVVSGTTITSNWANDTMTDIGNEMTNSLSRDGQGGMLAPLQFVDGDSFSPGISWILEPTMGFFRSGTQDMRAVVGNRDAIRITLTNRLEIQRDYGSGEEFTRAVDEGGYGALWAAHYDGFLDTGLHEEYTGDLDDIKINSVYVFNAGNVTNEPNLSWGHIHTHMHSNGNNGTQLIIGELGADVYKMWLRNLEGSVWGGWKLVVDNGAFPQRLAGYEDTGLQTRWTSDLDLIDFDSTYSMNGAVVNAPADMTTAFGFVTTFMWFSDTQFGTQIIYGMEGGNIYKQWMRTKASNVWGAWKLVVDGGAFPQRLAGLLDDGFHVDYNADLNDILSNSVYVIKGDQSTNGPSDFAQNAWGFITTEMFVSAGSGTQWLRGMDGTNVYKVWMRHRAGSVWNPWKLVVDGGAFTERFDGFLDTGLHAEAVNDLDTITFDSVFITNPNVVNIPSDFDPVNRGFLLTQMHLTTHGNQILWGRSSTNAYKVWMRSYHSSVWNEWKLVVDGNQLDFSNGQMVTNLPTSDPLVSGALWNNGGVVNVST